MFNLKQTLRRLLPWYVNGTLSGSEKHRVEQFLRSDEIARLDLGRWQALRQVVTARKHVSPSPVVKQRLLAQIHQEQTVKRPVFRPARVVSAVMLTLSVLILLWLAVKPGVVLQWSLESGGVSAFRVYRAPQGSSVFQLLGEIPAQASLRQYTYVDTLLVPGQTYTYRVEGIDNGGLSALSQAITGNSLDVLPVQLLMMVTSMIIGWGIVTLVTTRHIRRWDKSTIV